MREREREERREGVGERERGGMGETTLDKGIEFMVHNNNYILT